MNSIRVYADNFSFFSDYEERSERVEFTEPNPWSQIDLPRTGKKILKKPREPVKRKKPKSKVLKEIRTYQTSTELLIPKIPFRRLVREIATSLNPSIRFQESAMQALQEASEAFIIGMMEDGLLCTLHAKRVTIMKQDLSLAQRIRGERN